MRNKFLNTGEKGYHPIRKIRVAFAGLRYAVLHDLAVTYKVAISLPVLGVCLYMHEWLDFGLVFAATGMMLIAEMFNTTIEALCDFLETGHHERIGIIKDVAAGAAAISIVVWAVVLMIEGVRVYQLLW